MAVATSVEVAEDSTVGIEVGVPLGAITDTLALAVVLFALARMVWGPLAAPVGIRKSALKVPLPSVTAVDMPVVEPSQPSTTRARLGKLAPETLTVTPCALTIGSTEMLGPVDGPPARPAPDGKASSRSRTAPKVKIGSRPTRKCRAATRNNVAPDPFWRRGHHQRT